MDAADGSRLTTSAELRGALGRSYLPRVIAGP